MSEESTETGQPAPENTAPAPDRRPSLVLGIAIGAGVVFAMVLVAAVTAFIVARGGDDSSSTPQADPSTREGAQLKISGALTGKQFADQAKDAPYGIAWLGDPGKGAAIRVNTERTNYKRNTAEVGYLSADQNKNFDPNKPDYSVLVSTVPLPAKVTYKRAAKQKPPAKQATLVRGRNGLIAYIPSGKQQATGVPILFPGANGRAIAGQLLFKAPQSPAQFKQAVSRVVIAGGR